MGRLLFQGARLDYLSKQVQRFKVDFILVDTYSPYITIVAKPWLHALGAVSSTLHLKVKYPSGDHIKELVGSQFMARQCLVATIMH